MYTLFNCACFLVTPLLLNTCRLIAYQTEAENILAIEWYQLCYDFSDKGNLGRKVLRKGAYSLDLDLGLWQLIMTSQIGLCS